MKKPESDSRFFFVRGKSALYSVYYPEWIWSEFTFHLPFPLDLLRYLCALDLTIDSNAKHNSAVTPNAITFPQQIRKFLLCTRVLLQSYPRFYWAYCFHGTWRYFLLQRIPRLSQNH